MSKIRVVIEGRKEDSGDRWWLACGDQWYLLQSPMVGEGERRGGGEKGNNQPESGFRDWIFKNILHQWIQKLRKICPYFLSLFQGTFVAIETRTDGNKLLGLSSHSHHLEGNSKSPESYCLFLGECENEPFSRCQTGTGCCSHSAHEQYTINKLRERASSSKCPLEKRENEVTGNSEQTLSEKWNHWSLSWMINGHYGMV